VHRFVVNRSEHPVGNLTESRAQVTYITPLRKVYLGGHSVPSAPRRLSLLARQQSIRSLVAAPSSLCTNFLPSNSENQGCDFHERLKRRGISRSNKIPFAACNGDLIGCVPGSRKPGMQRAGAPAIARVTTMTASAAASGAGSGAPVLYTKTVFAWALLALTILLEVSGTTCMKLSNGFEHVVPSIFVFVSYLACFSCLTYAMKFWQVSTAYALWSGLGTALTAVIGVLVFKEPMSLMKFTSLMFIVLGVIGLNLAGH